MRLLPFLSLLALPAALRAEAPQPLRFIPKEANLLVRVEKPRRLVESVTGLDLVREMQTLPFVREALLSPVYQRFRQLLGYYEKELGTKWPELLDRLAANGITLATKGGDGAPVLLVIDGSDAELAERFLKLGVQVYEQELARQESKEKVERGEYRGTPGVKLGELHIARAGAALVIANKKEALKAALDQHLDGKPGLAAAPGPAAARKALPADCLAWLWFNLDVARQSPESKETFALPSNDPVQLFLIGGWTNAVKRAPFLAAGLTREADGFRLALRMPGGGREGLPAALALHVPPKGAPAPPPLLEPPGALLSDRFYFDFDVLYKQRSGLFNEKIARDFEEGERQVRKFLFGNAPATLAAKAGPWHRVVVAQRQPTAYATRPKQQLPAFAYVNTMRDPAVARPLEGILRSIALTAGNPFKPKLVDEMHGGIKITGYRFREGIAVADDPEDTRFNFSPCFAVVNNQFLMASTIEFGRELVDLLQKESARSAGEPEPAPFRIKFYGGGGAEFLRNIEEQVLGQIVLDQAVPPAEGRRQMEALLAWLRRLGTLELRSEYGEKEFRFNAVWRINHDDTTTRRKDK